MSAARGSIFDQEVYESLAFEKECTKENAVVMFARQANSHVRKQVHTLCFTNAVVRFPPASGAAAGEAAETYATANTGKATLVLKHDVLTKEPLQKCVFQEKCLEDFFKPAKYNKTKRGRKM